MKRSELYAAVWGQAPAQLAAQLSMSDTALRALCRRHDVPVPPRGYWAKVAAGKAVDRILLPAPEDDREIALRRATARAALDVEVAADVRNDAEVGAHETSTPCGDVAFVDQFRVEICRGSLVVRSVWPLASEKRSASWVAELLPHFER